MVSVIFHLPTYLPTWSAATRLTGGGRGGVGEEGGVHDEKEFATITLCHMMTCDATCSFFMVFIFMFSTRGLIDIYKVCR